MTLKVSSNCFVRKEEFGAFCYIHSRNDFFAINTELSNLLFALLDGNTPDLRSIDQGLIDTALKVGILEKEGVNPEPYSAPSLIGLEEVPSGKQGEILVANCFCTSFCPLRCTYCHADDLMSKKHREMESPSGLQDAINSAVNLEPMVYVVTGGDPITRPERAREMILELSKTNKPIVLDTSGSGNILNLLEEIKKYNIHVRVSLDSFHDVINTRSRPLNKRIIKSKRSSLEMALDTIKILQKHNVNITVQTVLTTRNSGLNDLRGMRDSLVKLGIKNWVLHNMVIAGKQAQLSESAHKSGKPTPLKPKPSLGQQTIQPLIDETISSRKDIDIRYTQANLAKNCVVLVSSDGEIYTEGNLTSGKKVIATPLNAHQKKFNWYLLNNAAHISRYLNCEVNS